VCDVAARPDRVVALQEAHQPLLAAGQRLAALALLLPAVGADDHLEEVEDRSVLDDDPAVHVGLADAEARILGDVEADLAVGEADREVPTAARAERLRRLA